ncbi:MAG: universal stress protein [Arenicellales bacterium]
MALKDLLVHVDDSKAVTARLEVATRLAAQSGAHLTGLFVLPSVAAIPLYVEVQIPADVLEEKRKADLDRAAEAEKAFKKAADNAGLSSEWRFVEDDVAATLSLHGRYVDLLILGQADASDASSLSEGVVEDVILDAGRPVLVIPYIGAPRSMGKRVLVAWNGSREAMRAVHDALPLLEKAELVDVLSINPPAGSGGGGHVPGADVSLHLARHGIRVETTFTEARELSVGDALLSRASDKQIDLIVMGGYGHSRYRELIVGGATRQILESMTVPVLMSH